MADKNVITRLLPPLSNPGPRFIDLTGKMFGKLIVMRLLGHAIKPDGGRGNTVWLCQCECGSETRVWVGNLNKGHTRSCGCLRPEANKTHGMHKSRLYSVWQAMKRRCHSPTDPGYARYGGRGITVCDRWRDSFENFYADMGEPPEGYSLERKDNNQGYNPDNCKWATDHQQKRNISRNRWITFEDKTQILMDWSRELGIDEVTLYYRLTHGWTIAQAFNRAPRPSLGRKRHHSE